MLSSARHSWHTSREERAKVSRPCPRKMRYHVTGATQIACTMDSVTSRICASSPSPHTTDSRSSEKFMSVIGIEYRPVVAPTSRCLRNIAESSMYSTNAMSRPCSNGSFWKSDWQRHGFSRRTMVIASTGPLLKKNFSRVAKLGISMIFQIGLENDAESRGKP